MKAVKLVGVDGSIWPLTSVEHAGVFLKAEPVDFAAEPESGKTTGTLELVIADNSPTGKPLRPISVSKRQWHNAWSLRKWSKLIVSGGDGGQDYFMEVKLSSPIPDFSELDPEGYVEFLQSVIGRSKSWLRAVSHHAPIARAANTGDFDVWPRMRWQQAGVLVMPSGAAVEVPAVDSPRTVWLDPKESCVVKDDAGVIDRDLWISLRGNIFPEVLPADDQYREFHLPDGAVLLYEVEESPW